MSGRVAVVAAFIMGVGCGARSGLDSVAYVDVGAAGRYGGTAGSGAASSGAPDGAASRVASCSGSIDFHDGTPDGLTLGPGNQVLDAPTIEQDAIGDEAEIVFPGSYMLLQGEFIGTQVGGPGTTGELALAPFGCGSTSLAGHSVTVTFRWNLDISDFDVPAHGLSLATYVNGQSKDYDDAKHICDGGDCTPLFFNTDAPVVLTHTFSPGEVASGGIFLRVYLASPNGGVSTSVEVGSIVWR
jgi:hypothetical protein